ncbi:hypothetical protein Z043_106848 [Scleropages formosus]|uniref:Uncharacterized protein n=1 Tax=Scleropages formosus TaxID=113540 RepID=A0A0P7VF51_SCLFO|nr:hypothetical protein Z043_106848 [Scleropages formosus]
MVCVCEEFPSVHGHTHAQLRCSTCALNSCEAQCCREAEMRREFLFLCRQLCISSPMKGWMDGSLLYITNAIPLICAVVHYLCY